MANIRNYGLDGIAAVVQLGKAGPRLRADTTDGTFAIEARDATGSLLVPVRAAPAVLNSEVVVKEQLDTVAATAEAANSKDGFDILLGDPTKGDGSFTNPAGAIVLNASRKVSSAIDDINEILGLLVPSQPPQLTASALSVTSVGATPLLASGAVPDNTSGGSIPVTAGQSATRITAADVTSNTFGDVGPGNSGTISLLVNGTTVGSRALSTGVDDGTYNGLIIADDKAFPPTTPGFWESVDVSVNAPVAQGWNRIRLQHSNNIPQLTNEVFFVRDNLTAFPEASNLTVSQNAAGTLAYSSSVPHYNTGASLTVGLSYTNLSGEFYYGGTDPVTISGQNSVFSPQNFDYMALGIATPVARQTTTATAVTPVTVAVNPTHLHHSGVVQALARNVNGASAIISSTTTILVANGMASSRIDETGIGIRTLGTGSGNAVRVGMSSGDTPSLSRTAWDSAAPLSAHEAAVVGGVLSHNQTNYSTGFLPVGPDLSMGRADAQYITFAITRSAVSTFRINVNGSYAGVWIGLPGVSNNSSISPNAIGGAWWNAFAAYIGSGVPGRAGDANAGAASGTVMSGSSGTFTFTFGPQSSSNATGNVILVRFRLDSGQSITALSFSN